MSDYRCWVCDTEFYKGEEDELRRCCSNVKTHVKNLNYIIIEQQENINELKELLLEHLVGPNKLMSFKEVYKWHEDYLKRVAKKLNYQPYSPKQRYVEPLDVHLL